MISGVTSVLQIVALHLVVAPPVDEVLVVRLGRFLGQHFAAFLRSRGAAFALLLVAPGAELRLDPEQAVAQEQHDQQHDEPDDDQADRPRVIRTLSNSTTMNVPTTAPSARPMPPITSMAKPSSTVSKLKIENATPRKCAV